MLAERYMFYAISNNIANVFLNDLSLVSHLEFSFFFVRLRKKFKFYYHHNTISLSLSKKSFYIARYSETYFDTLFAGIHSYMVRFIASHISPPIMLSKCWIIRFQNEIFLWLEKRIHVFRLQLILVELACELHAENFSFCYRFSMPIKFTFQQKALINFSTLNLR